jgi:hypothetical protein
MFIHLGTLSSQTFGNYSIQTTNAGPAYAYGMIAASIALSKDPIILNPSSNVCDFTADFTDPHVDNVFNLIDYLQRPVYLHVGLIPSGTRLSLDTAIADAEEQMSTMFTLMQGYNCLHLLKGFCLDHVSQGFTYADGSSWDRNSFNEIVDYTHQTFNCGVAAIINPSLDAVSLFTPPNRTASALFTQAPSKLCSSPAYTDYLIHVDPIFVSPLCNRGAFSPDMSRVSGMLQIMKTMPNINHAVVQGFDFESVTQFDNITEAQMNQLQLRTIRRTAYFLECLGVANYSFCADTAYGSYSDIVLHPGTYRPLANLDPSSTIATNTAGVDNVYITSDVKSITVMRRDRVNGDAVLGTFDKQLLETPAAEIASSAYNTPVYVYPFEDAFGGDIRDETSYSDVPPIFDAFGKQIPIALCDEIQGVFDTDPLFYLADDPLADAFDVVFLNINLQDHLADTLNIGAPSNGVGPTCYTYTDAFGVENLGDIALEDVADAFGVNIYTPPDTDFIFQYPPLAFPQDVLDDPSSW